VSEAPWSCKHGTLSVFLGLPKSHRFIGYYTLYFINYCSDFSFRYSTPFANYRTNLIDKLEPLPDASIAFICSPIAFVAFHHLHPQTNTHLPELDRRFAILAPGQYISYDLDGPNNFPVELREYFGCDLVVVNLPLLNEVSFRSGGPYH